MTATAKPEFTVMELWLFVGTIALSGLATIFILTV
jgi:hypothetical protein